MEMITLNKKGPVDHPYIAGFKNQKVGLYASSLAAAKQKAVEHFKPKKSTMGLLWVALAEEETSDSQ